MPRGQTDELTDYVRALRRLARQVRRRAFHDKEAERQRAFANYLDVHADALEAKPTSSAATKVPTRLPCDDAQTVTVTEQALVTRLNRKLRNDLMALRRVPQNGPDASRSGRPPRG